MKPIDLQINIQNLPNVAKEQADINIRPLQLQMHNADRVLKRIEDEKMRTDELHKDSKADDDLQHEYLEDYVNEENNKKNHHHEKKEKKNYIPAQKRIKR